MIGSHVIKCWSATQASVALSSGEAESTVACGPPERRWDTAPYGMADLGLDIKVRVWTDSSAAIGTSSRQGLGKLRHIECHTLWVQQRIRQGECELRKVRG